MDEAKEVTSTMVEAVLGILTTQSYKNMSKLMPVQDSNGKDAGNVQLCEHPYLFESFLDDSEYIGQAIGLTPELKAFNPKIFEMKYPGRRYIRAISSSEAIPINIRKMLFEAEKYAYSDIYKEELEASEFWYLGCTLPPLEFKIIELEEDSINIYEPTIKGEIATHYLFAQEKI
jgi:hypothetical protein